MVYEEKFITKYNVPALQAVGWEGKIDLICSGICWACFSSRHIWVHYSCAPPYSVFFHSGLFTLCLFHFLKLHNQVGPQFGHGPRHVLEDAYDGCYQLAHNPLLALAFSGTIISIAFFNFAGISVTKELSATTRMVLDSIRTLVIWMVRWDF